MRKKHLIFIAIFMATSLISGVAYSKANGTISGRVTDPSGNGIANVSVGAFDHNDNWISSSSADVNGNYRLNVSAGNYKLRFSQSPSDGYYAPAWYNNKSNSVVADFVIVTAFRTTSNINARLEIGGTVSGRVTDASGGAIANVYVGALDTKSFHWIYGLNTDSNGNYSFNLPVGTYKLYFGPSPSSGYNAPQWYDTKSDSQAADLVTITSQTTSIIDAQLQIGAMISGYATGPQGNGISNVYVDATDPNNNWISGSSTDSRGRYTFTVPPGTYIIYFSPDSSDGYYAPQWYNNKNTAQMADSVTATLLETTFNINAQLQIGGKISGRLIDISGDGVADVLVQAYSTSHDNVVLGGATTNSQGFYTILLPQGNYKVRFSATPNSGDYATQWYNGKSDFESADTVTVKKFRNSTVNMQLQPK